MCYCWFNTVLGFQDSDRSFCEGSSIRKNEENYQGKFFYTSIYHSSCIVSEFVGEIFIKISACDLCSRSQNILAFTKLDKVVWNQFQVLLDFVS